MSCARRYVACVAMLLVASILGARETSAEPIERVLVFLPHAPEVDISIAGRAGVAVLQALELAGYTDVENRLDTSINDAVLLMGCPTATADCLTELATTLEADAVVFGTMTERPDGYELAVTFFDAHEEANVFSATAFVAEDQEMSALQAQVLAYVRGDPVLHVSSTPGGALVVVDGVERGRAPLVVADIGPGAHQLSVSESGYRTATRSVELSGRQLHTATVELEPLPPSVAAQAVEGPGPERGGTSSTRRTTGWALVGTGGATLVAAGVFGLLTAQTQSDFDGTELQREAYDLADTGRTRARATNALLAVGTIATAGGVALLVMTRAGDDAEDGELSLGVSPSAGGGAVRMRLRFR